MADSKRLPESERFKNALVARQRTLSVIRTLAQEYADIVEWQRHNDYDMWSDFGDDEELRQAIMGAIRRQEVIITLILAVSSGKPYKLGTPWQNPGKNYLNARLSEGE